MGGRRRRSGKKTMKGGNMFGVGGVITAGALEYKPITNNGGMDASQIGASDINKGPLLSGGRRRTQRKMKMTAKAMKRILKKNGMKVSGKKATLTKRMKKARLMKGGAAQEIPMGGVAGFTGVGAAAGLGGYQDVSGGKPNHVVPLSG
jgi:hypothetical protein